MRKESFTAKKGTFLDKLLQHWRFSKIRKYIGENKTICDLGCGFDGRFLLDNKYRLRKGIGLDVSVNMSSNDEKVELKEANFGRPLPLEGESFDVATSLAVIEHLNNSDAYLREALRILKRGGVLILTTPDPKGEKILNFLSKLSLIDKKEIADHKKYFAPEEMCDALIKAGFSKVDHTSFECGFNNLFLATR
jgi:ubiquinone/menaquinone biosynthesis C-methylase UbiE